MTMKTTLKNNFLLKFSSDHNPENNDFVQLLLPTVILPTYINY
jgi:hypothetical protein